MKSSTLRRSTLSKETIAVIENLAKNAQETAPVEFVRPEELLPKMSVAEKEKRSKEIDLLWQNFKTTQFNTKSPFAYILCGFVLGVITTVLVGGSISYYLSKNPSNISAQGIIIDKIKIFDNNKKPEQEKKTQPSVNIPKESDNNKVIEVNNIKKSDKTEETGSTQVANAEKYIVQQGDTGVTILKRHYGKYSPEIEDKVKEANGLPTLDKIYIGQELVLP